MQNKAEEFAQGTRHPIRYNPQNPNDLRYDLGMNFCTVGVPIFIALVGVPFFVAAYFFLGLIRWVRSLVCPTCGQNLTRGQATCPHCGASAAA